MKDCRYFESCSRVHEEFQKIKDNDVAQTAGMESLHERQTVADGMREELSGAISGLNSVVGKLAEDLKHHMEWEENKAELAEKAKAATDAATSIYMWIGGLIFTGATMFTTYMFNSVNVATQDIVSIKKENAHNVKQTDKIEEMLISNSKLLYTIAGEVGPDQKK